MLWSRRILTLERMKNPAANPVSHLELGIVGFTWSDLQNPIGLRALLQTFDAELRAADAPLAERYLSWRASGGVGVPEPEVSRLLIDIAAYVSRFVGRLFGAEVGPAGTASRATRRRAAPGSPDRPNPGVGRWLACWT